MLSYTPSIKYIFIYLLSKITIKKWKEQSLSFSAVIELHQKNKPQELQQAYTMEISLFTVGMLSLVLFLISCLKWKKYMRDNRITHYRDRQTRRIQDDKILIAIEPIDIFIEIATSRKDRFIQLHIEKKGLAKVVQAVKKFFGIGCIYYRIKDKKHNNVAFIESLLQTKRVELFLYTTLDEQTAEILLKKLDLSKYFNHDRRRFCHGASESLKHPTEIDSNTKRVIIITGSKHDHTDEDSEYFLVAKKKEIKLYGKQLADLITNIKSIDELHHEFVHWKIDIQSDYDSSHDKQQ